MITTLIDRFAELAAYVAHLVATVAGWYVTTLTHVADLVTAPARFAFRVLVERPALAALVVLALVLWCLVAGALGRRSVVLVDAEADSGAPMLGELLDPAGRPVTSARDTRGGR
jgi:hypothetical protein